MEGGGLLSPTREVGLVLRRGKGFLGRGGTEEDGDGLEERQRRG